MNETVCRKVNISISPCGVYRYSLYRGWGTKSYWLANVARFVMLNPSTADATQDDPTIRRCISFARSWGCDGIIVVNLFAYRTAYPAQLRSAYMKGIDVVGPDNSTTFQDVMLDYDPIVVAAWGAGVPAGLRSHVETVRGWIEGQGAVLQCLGKTKAGHPRHPLYVRSGTSLEAL